MAWLPPRAGELRDRLRIERQASVSDGMGGTLEDWTELLDAIPAKITEAKGTETVRSDRLAGTAAVDVVIRATTATRTITPADRAVDARTGRLLDIRWVGSLDDAGRWLVLSCEAGGPSHG